jgi:catechol 2,3-dioxygenase-like lactoylglutathione lyase family enzyme
MILNISLMTVYCLDQDATRDFYVRNLGFEPRVDQTFGPDIRWTVYGAYQLEGKQAYDEAIEGPGFVTPPKLDVVRMVEQDNVVMAEITGVVERRDDEPMRMSMAEVFVMRDGLIAERRAWVIELKENDYR